MLLILKGRLFIGASSYHIIWRFDEVHISRNKPRNNLKNRDDRSHYSNEQQACTSRPSTGFSQRGHKSKCIDGFSYPIGIIASGIYRTYDKNIIEEKEAWYLARGWLGMHELQANLLGHCTLVRRCVLDGRYQLSTTSFTIAHEMCGFSSHMIV